MSRFEDSWCYEVLRRHRWRHGVTCVRCGSRHVTVHTRAESEPRRKYLCLQCRRVFTDLTGTIFARSNLPLSRWFLGLTLVRDGLSTGEYARAVSVKWDTARRMSRALLIAVDRNDLVREIQHALLTREDAPRTE